MTVALVLFSGGQDSTTCLAWALSRFEHVETIGFDYGQRHVIEMAQRQPIRESIVKLNRDWKRRLGPDHVIALPSLQDSNGLARSDGFPSTFIPGRNLLFLLHAAIVAERRGIRLIVGGMCETDFSGYPDCRDDAMKAMQLALNIGMAKRFVIETPLMWIDKAQTFALAEHLGGKKLVSLIIEETHTCYAGDRSERHPWGYGCAVCPACKLRARGWQRYSVS